MAKKRIALLVILLLLTGCDSREKEPVEQPGAEPQTGSSQTSGDWLSEDAQAEEKQREQGAESQENIVYANPNPGQEASNAGQDIQAIPEPGGAIQEQQTPSSFVIDFDNIPSDPFNLRLLCALARVTDPTQLTRVAMSREMEDTTYVLGEDLAVIWDMMGRTTLTGEGADAINPSSGFPLRLDFYAMTPDETEDKLLTLWINGLVSFENGRRYAQVDPWVENEYLELYSRLLDQIQQ